MKHHVVILLLAFAASFYACNTKSAAGGKTDYVTVETRLGTIKIMLYNETPYHTENILKLADEGYYDELLVHRVVKNFLVEMGDETSRNVPPYQTVNGGSPGYTLPTEPGFPHFRGTVAASQEKGASETNGAKFYIVVGKPVTDAQLDGIERSKGFEYTQEQRELYKKVGGTPNLDMENTVFGEVVEGYDVVEKLLQEELDGKYRPLIDVKTKIRRVK